MTNDVNDVLQPNWEQLVRRYDLPGQPEWQKLLTHFDLSEGFALVMLLVTDADGAALCRHELEKQLQTEGKQLIAIELPTPDALRNLPAHFLETKLPPTAACLWVGAVSPDYTKDYPEWRDAWQTALARLNAFRNPIREKFPLSVIFAGAPWLQPLMRETAPDLWSVRTVVVNIQPAASPEILPVPRTTTTLSDLGQSDPVLALQDAEKLRGIPGKELSLARLLHRAGEGFGSQHKWRFAETCFTESLELKRRFKAPPTSLINTLNQLATTCRVIGQIKRSIELLDEAIQIAQKNGDKRGESKSLRSLGNAYFGLGNARKAIEFYERDLAVSREIGDRRGEGASLGNIGTAYAALAETRKAIIFYDQHLAIAREVSDRGGESNALGNLGLAFAALGDTRKAVEYYEQVLVVMREIGDRRGEGTVLSALGLAYATLGDLQQSIKYHEQALAIDREIGDRRGEGADLGNLGLAYADLGDTRKAIEFQEHALIIAREIGDRRGEGNALGNLGIAHAALGDAHKAIEFYEQHLAIAREIGDQRGEGMALWNSALSFYELDNRTEAINRAEAALKIYEAIESPHAAKVSTILAEWRKNKQP